jgi:hypothetical protein
MLYNLPSNLKFIQIEIEFSHNSKLRVIISQSNDYDSILNKLGLNENSRFKQSNINPKIMILTTVN